MGDETCPAALHNYNGTVNRMFDHDCTLIKGHLGYHACGRHHIDTEGGCVHGLQASLFTIQ